MDRAGRSFKRVRVAIIGTGFSGLGAAICLKRKGVEDFVIFERASDVGGTWRDNTYPGCQCDVPSHLYSFSFLPNPDWTRTYSTQPEIWEYLRTCAEKTGVVQHVRFDHEVKSMSWRQDDGCWEIETSQGTWIADCLISAQGGLAEPSVPNIKGLDRFTGRVVHSAAWDPDLELDGLKVAVVGTGASAIQIVPRIQPKVDRLHLFQRTPAWVLPHTDRPISDRERLLYRRVPGLQRALRGFIYLLRETLVLGMAKRPVLLKPLQRLAERHLRNQVPDPELRRKLTPSYSPGCKRLLLSDTYYPALVAEGSELVTDPIQEVSERSIVTADGAEREVDVIVLATGFRVTDNPMWGSVFGRDGKSLSDVWRAGGMRAYLGTTVSGFPNLFFMTGPNTGIGHTSLVVMIEAQINYVVRCLEFMASSNVRSVEVRPEAVVAFNEKLQRRMQRTVWTQGGCSSWYLDEKGNNTTLWPDFTWRFKRATKTFKPDDYLVERSTVDERVSVTA